MSTKPLVSILIPNFNHSRYLDQCIQSALNQTYENIEITVLDNCSTDNSLSVAAKYIDQGVLVCKNQMNIMNRNYRVLANNYSRGKYFILLCADDYILPEFIEKAVDIMEKYPNVAYVHGERDFVDEQDNLIELDPFYKCSFVADGNEAMGIYMVTTVAHPAQAVVRTSVFNQNGGYDIEIDHMNADRSLWFYLSHNNDIAYIRDKMAHIRVGAQTETFITQKNFQHPILCHLSLLDYIKFAKNYGIDSVLAREEEAKLRLAKDFVGYAAGMLYEEEYDVAAAYLDYSRIICRDIENYELFVEYMQMYMDRSVNKELIKGRQVTSYYHKRSYEPPKNYMEIET